MTYWLCITTKDNWEISQKIKILGFKKRVQALSNMIKIGDIGFIYIKKGSMIPNPYIIAKFKIISSLHTDESELFQRIDEYPKELFPQRVDIEIITIPNKPLIFKPMVDNLTFIKNKRFWGITLFGRSLINLSNSDYQLINSNLNSH